MITLSRATKLSNTGRLVVTNWGWTPGLYVVVGAVNIDRDLGWSGTDRESEVIVYSPIVWECFNRSKDVL